MTPAAPARESRLAAALGWTPAEPITARTLAIAALGMSVPALVGLATHRAEIGFTIGLGALLLADAPQAASAADARPAPALALLPAALAVALATVLSGEAWSDVAMIALAGVAASLSGYSRPVAVAAIRFIVYFVLSFTLLQSAGGHRGAAALIFGLGAVWNILLRVLLTRVRPAKAETAEALPASPPTRVPTGAQRRAYFRRTLTALAGWQFPIRVVLGLTIADGLRLAFPTHHYGWIVLSVALLTQRPIEHLPVKTLQRAAGTALGVGITWGIVASLPPPAVIGVMICGLAAAASLARPRNYLLYSSLSTPVILLVLDLGKPIQTALLTDRLIATVVGASLVIALNVMMDRLMSLHDAGAGETRGKAGPRSVARGEKPLTGPPARRPTRP